MDGTEATIRGDSGRQRRLDVVLDLASITAMQLDEQASSAGDDRNVGAEHIEHARRRATPTVVDVLKRHPEAPHGGGRVGELLRYLDQALRSRF
jgi:hypothetical protein